MKVVINVDYGGFGLSEDAMREYLKRSNLPFAEQERDQHGFVNFRKGEKDYYWDGDIDRNDPILVAVVEEMGEKSWGRYSRLKVVEIPDGIEWFISEYDGREHVAEEHRTWY